MPEKSISACNLARPQRLPRDLLQPLAGHVVEQPADVFGGDVRFQGPGGIGLSNGSMDLGRYP